MRVLIATSNKGKLRDFAGAAAVHSIDVESLPGFKNLPEPVEDGATFEANARKKAEHYSRFAAGELVLADDSGLSVDALDGAPGVYSARYSDGANGNGNDAANNAKLLRELDTVAEGQRTAKFVCVISAARDGREVMQFRGESAGVILREPRGAMGFGYDPLFYFPALAKSFAELTPDEKAVVSHRGAALKKFLEWASENS
ncbi:MAG: non-canonical purine NTP pyrophosphatase, RdgB/HAM1 family [Acidobacteria bacterium]|nr:MAG: non-canonical purine NTP pyrophosphatase, RdgB/HAM1 family [Acidobacteriota bacterium]